jgi:hypothetical protein
MENIKSLDEQIREAKALRSAGMGAPAGASGRRRLTPEERAQRLAEYEAGKMERREARERRKAERQAELAAERGTPHMKKVEKAAAVLPMLENDEGTRLNALLEDFNVDSLEKIMLHLEHHVRAERTRAALNTKLRVGQVVKVLGGSAKFHGAVGVVAKVQRIRCYVTLPGMEKPQYFFCSDVSPLADEDASTVTDSPGEMLDDHRSSAAK